jgi:hypothetical protein
LVSKLASRFSTGYLVVKELPGAPICATLPKAELTLSFILRCGWREMTGCLVHVIENVGDLVSKIVQRRW